MDELARRVDNDFAEQLARQPGFVSYEFIDCGFGEFMTMSVFLELAQAEASRELAVRWAQENRDALEFPRIEAAHGQIVVGRVAEEMLEETHIGGAQKFASVRRYRVLEGAVDALMGRIDTILADRLEATAGFAATHVFDCGEDEVLWITFASDIDAAAECDERTFGFVSEELREFRLERRSALSGRLLVSRATAALLARA